MNFRGVISHEAISPTEFTVTLRKVIKENMITCFDLYPFSSKFQVLLINSDKEASPLHLIF